MRWGRGPRRGGLWRRRSEARRERRRRNEYMSSKKIWALANIVGLAVTIVVSYLSSTGVFNGETMATMSAKYPTLITPAPYSFGIWGLIYVGLAGFVVYGVRLSFRDPASDDPAVRVGGWFVATCVANCCWVLAWLYGDTELSMFLMLVLLYALFRIVVLTDMELTDPPLRVIAFVWWPFCYYTGWIMVALLANLSAFFVKLGKPFFVLNEAGWATGMLVVAGLAYLVLTWKRNMRECALVGVWALVGIAVADWHRVPFVAKFALVIAWILFVSSMYHAWRNRAYGPFRKR
jgi:hypothetical protein